MTYIRKILSGLLICLLFTTGFVNTSFGFSNLPSGEVGEYGSWVTQENMDSVNGSMRGNTEEFQQQFQENIKDKGFVPIEAKLGFMFMQAMSPISAVLHKSLIPFTIMFLFIMYAFWVGLNAYKMIRESTDYKTVLYEIFKKGLIITVWVIILNFKPEEIFTMIVTPIISLGTYISSFILDSVAGMYDVDLPDTCGAIQDYVQNQLAAKDHLLIGDAKAAADIMCMPGRMSIFFYHAIGTAFKWIIWGFGHSVTAIAVGIVAIFIFLKCIFKYAFMTLGIVADLFFTILMLPFTALAEAMPSIDEKNYAGQIFSGLLKVFNTKKLSDVLGTFINTAVYFVSLSIIIAICSILLTLLISIGESGQFSDGPAITILTAGCLVLYLADKADELATQLGGKIDNSFGKQLQSDAKNMWGNIKKFGGKAITAWSKDKLFK